MLCSSCRPNVELRLPARFMVSTLPRLEREVWEYQLLEVDFKWKLWVQFSPDGVVREVVKMRHPDMDPPGNSAGKD